MKSQKSMAVLMILLILVMPLSSASAMAIAVSVDKNTGEAGIPNFIDGDGDTWTIEVTFSDVPADFNQERAKIRVGNSLDDFDSCTAGLGTQTCTYLSPLTTGVAEGSFEFAVLYEEQALKSHVINVDSSGPKVSFTEIEQIDQDIHLDFSVDEKATNAPFVGIAKIEIMDGDGKVLDTISDFTDKQQTYNYKESSGTGTKAIFKVEGDGNKFFKVRAVDNLGHSTTSTPKSLFVDYVGPKVTDMNFTQIGKFIGSTGLTLDLTAVIEDSGVLTADDIVATSSATDLKNTPASSCTKTGQKYVCVWKFVEIKPEASFAVIITAIDSKKNEGTLTKNFNLVKDTSPPVIEYFGTEHTYNNINYAAPGTNNVILILTEQGAGIESTNIRANLADLGGDSNQNPDECLPEEGRLYCVWKVGSPTKTDTVRITLKEARDNVGNEAKLQAVDVKVDSVKPTVESVILESGGLDYVKGGSTIELKVVVNETAGLNVLVDVEDVVNDPEAVFGDNLFNEHWAVFDETSCTRTEGAWDCTFVIPQVRSSFLKNAILQLEVYDTAGNEAENYPVAENMEQYTPNAGVYKLEILSVINEPNPDFWSVKPVKANNFVDLSSTKLTASRAIAKLSFKSKEATAQQITITSCTAPENAPPLRRQLLYGGANGVATSATATVVLELEPFDGTEFFKQEIEDEDDIVVSYTCDIAIISRVGENVLANAEVETATIKIPFGFTSLGGLGESLEDTIHEARDSGFTDFALVLQDINDVVEWANTINSLVIQPVIAILEIYNMVKVALDTPQKNPYAYSPITIMCGTSKVPETAATEIIEGLSTAVALLSCNPYGAPADSYFKGFFDYQKAVLKGYNELLTTEFDRKLTGYALGKPQTAKGLKDNIIISTIGICLPGIVENLEKMGQIQCRYITCLEKDVANGIPVSVCDQLKSQMWCKYVFGEAMEMLPVFSSISTVLGAVKGAATDFVGTAVSIALNLCSLSCGGSSAAAGFCGGATVVVKYANVVLGWFAAYDNIDSIDQDYCALIEEDQEKFDSDNEDDDDDEEDEEEPDEE
jgi:hypothetical protein